MRKIIAIAMIVIGLLSIAEPVLACNPPPTTSDCQSLGSGYRFGFRVNYPSNRTYRFTSRYGTLTGGAPADPNSYVKITNKHRGSFDWSSSLGIDAVVVRAGNASIVKRDSEAKSGHISISSRSSIDKVYFCYDYELEVTKTAEGTAAGASTWDISKTPSPLEQAKFAGEKAVFNYTVAVTRLSEASGSYHVVSNVEIKNNTPLSATIRSITDLLKPGDVPVTLNCGISNLPYTLPAGKSITCSGSAKLKAKLDGDNWVKVKTNGDVGGATASSKIHWSGGASTNSSITVTDTNTAFGGPYTVTGDKTWNYPVELACPSDLTAYGKGPQKVTLENNAEIVETGQDARTTVTLTCYKLDVTTSAIATASASTAWEITKNVTPETQVKFAGEKAKFDYTVAVKKLTEGSGGYQVATRVEIKNNTPLAATIYSITDMLKPGDTPVTLDCGISAYPYTLPAGGSITCTGTASLDSKLDGENWVSVKSNSDLSASSKIDWSAVTDPAPTGANTITVTDTNAAFGGPYTVQADKTWTYSAELPCPVDQAAYANGPVPLKLDNTAAITETGQSASKSASVMCYAPTISAATTVNSDVLYNWEIRKTASKSSLTLDIGQTDTVDFIVTTNVAGTTESNVKLSGAVTVNNPNPGADLSAVLTDQIASGVNATFTNCTNPVTVPAGGTLTCNFAVDLPAKSAGENIVTLTFNGLNWTATSAYDSANAVKNETDECVTVFDSRTANPLGTVCAPQAPGTFTYPLTVGPYQTCGSTSFLNTAWYETNDTHTQDFVNATVKVKVNCLLETNCTKPEGYWAASADPAKPDTYDATWDKVPPSGRTSPFFTTGYSWVDMLLTTNTNTPYNRLAHAYIAARLNVLFGAVPPTSVAANISHAEALLSKYANSQSSIAGALATDFNTTATKLTDFNRGLTLPGKCPNCQYDN